MEGHNLTIEQRQRVTATEIISVDAFSDRQIVLSYQGGRIVVSGTDMKIVAFSKTTGAFSAAGNISGARYIAKGASFAKKLFK